MKKSIVILGAGITGLVSAYYLSEKFQVYLIEKQPVAGGMSTSFYHNNLTLDYGPHKLYTQLPGIMSEIAKIVPLVKIKKKNSLYLLNNYFDFPLSLKQVALKMPGKAFSAGIDMFKKSMRKLPDINYENYLINRFGYTMYYLVFKSYAEKIWGQASSLDIELAKRRVAVSGIFQLVKSILMKDSSKISAEYFFYPALGIKQLVDNLIEKIKENKGVIINNAKIQEIKMNGRKIEHVKVSNKKIQADFLVSTIYLDNLLDYINADEDVIQACKKLSYIDLNIIYFILGRKAIKDNWIFFPEKKFLFNRISEQNSFSPYINKNNNILVVETTKELSDKNMEIIKKQLVSLGILDNNIKDVLTRKLARAYPLYKKGYKKNLGMILNYLDKIENLYLIGRQGLFNYNNIDQCWDMSKKLAEHIIQDKNKKQWAETRKIFSSYKIVD